MWDKKRVATYSRKRTKENDPFDAIIGDMKPHKIESLQVKLSDVHNALNLIDQNNTNCISKLYGMLDSPKSANPVFNDIVKKNGSDKDLEEINLKDDLCKNLSDLIISNSPIDDIRKLYPLDLNEDKYIDWLNIDPNKKLIHKKQYLNPAQARLQNFLMCKKLEQGLSNQHSQSQENVNELGVDKPIKKAQSVNNLLKPFLPHFENLEIKKKPSTRQNIFEVSIGNQNNKCPPRSLAASPILFDVEDSYDNHKIIDRRGLNCNSTMFKEGIQDNVKGLEVLSISSTNNSNLLLTNSNYLNGELMLAPTESTPLPSPMPKIAIRGKGVNLDRPQAFLESHHPQNIALDCQGPSSSGQNPPQGPGLIQSPTLAENLPCYKDRSLNMDSILAQNMLREEDQNSKLHRDSVSTLTSLHYSLPTSYQKSAISSCYTAATGSFTARPQNSDLEIEEGVEAGEQDSDDEISISDSPSSTLNETDDSCPWLETIMEASQEESLEICSPQSTENELITVVEVFRKSQADNRLSLKQLRRISVRVDLDENYISSKLDNSLSNARDTNGSSCFSQNPLPPQIQCMDFDLPHFFKSFQHLVNAGQIFKFDNLMRHIKLQWSSNIENFRSRERDLEYRKMGEGSYGEVYGLVNTPEDCSLLGEDKILSIFKVIPLDSKKLESSPGTENRVLNDIISEIIISRTLGCCRESQATRDSNLISTTGFITERNLYCCGGNYPHELLVAWDLYKGNHPKMCLNERPDSYEASQMYLVIEQEYGGHSLEHFQFDSIAQIRSFITQLLITLDLAEKSYSFEHRDLHWGNILIQKVKNDAIIAYPNGRTLASEGIKASIIDFTLSRLTIDNLNYFCGLSAEVDLFKGKGEYQYEIYRLMKKRNMNDWESFTPYTNVLWLSYIIRQILGVKLGSLLVPRSKCNSLDALEQFKILKKQLSLFNRNLIRECENAEEALKLFEEHNLNV